MVRKEHNAASRRSFCSPNCFQMAADRNSLMLFQVSEPGSCSLGSRMGMLTKSKKEPWGPTGSRCPHPDGLLVGLTFTSLKFGSLSSIAVLAVRLSGSPAWPIPGGGSPRLSLKGSKCQSESPALIDGGLAVFAFLPLPADGYQQGFRVGATYVA